MRPERIKRHARSERGFFLVPVICFVVTVVTFGLVLSDTSTHTVDRAEFHSQDMRLEAIAEAAVDLAMNDLWSEYTVSLGQLENTASRFRSFLDGKGILARALPSANDVVDPLAELVSDEKEWVDLFSALSTNPLPKSDAGLRTLMGAPVHSLEVLRQDAPDATVLRARAVVSFGDDLSRRHSREVEILYSVGGEVFEGFGFALLANNVNCIMCHATIDSADRYYNRDPSLTGTFARVRVGTLESLKIRTGSAQSSVAGTLYTRGPVMDKSGSLLSSLAGSSLDSAVFNEDGKLVETSTGLLTAADFVNAPGDPPTPGANLYMNYPRAEEKQTDGVLPSEFPPVIPDENANRLVDDEEYAAVAERATGSLQGGRKAVVAPADTYRVEGLPVFPGPATLQGSVQGNLVAYGTSSSPLVIDGRITVDGDVVIGGLVRGSGEIIARKNTYIVGSLSYNDGVSLGARTFGVAPDGSTNRLTLGAGGNILVGDFLRSKGGGDPVTGAPDGEFNFTLSETTIFGQMEWIRAQPKVESGGKSSALIDNPVYDPTHVPRYYVIRPDNPVAIFNKRDTYFDVGTLTWLGKEHLGGWSDSSLTYLPLGSEERSKSVALPLMPATGWLTATQLVTMWDQCEDAHPGGPLLVDAFLYTNNAIFLVTAKSSAYGGKALINGGIVGADLGILVAGGLQLNYDGRHQDVMKLRKKKADIHLQRGPRLR